MEEEKTEQFFLAAKTDPYTNIVLHHVANAWANGYEQALRDHGLTDARLRESHNDRFNRALEWLTDARRKSEAEAIVALAAIGRLELAAREVLAKRDEA